MLKDKKTKIIIGSLCGVLIICLIVVLLVKTFAKPQYEIKFDTDGGSQISSLKVQKGDVISKPQDPAKEGYVFTGWYLNNQEYDFKDKVTTNLTLKAKWLEEEKFHLNTDKMTLKVGDKVTLEASAKELTWQSSDEKIVKVNQKGQVTALKVGKATITVTNKKGEKVECNVTIQEKDDNEIVLSKITIKGNKEIEMGKTTKLTITYTPKDATNQKVTWSSSNIQIATVDQKGNVKGLKAGKITITATSENGLKATYEVTIKAKTQSTTPSSGTTPTTNPSTGTTPSGGSGGSGSGGNGTGTTPGTTPNSGQSTGTTEQPKVEATKITITGSTKVNVNEGIDLKVNFEPTNTTDKTVTWSSSSISIATVDQNGHVVGKAEGTVTITAKTKNGKEATYQIEVKSIYVIYLTANYLMGNLSDYSFKVERDGKVFTDYESFDIVGNAYYPSNGVVGKDDVTDLGSERTTTLKLKNGQTRQATIVINK